MQILNFNRPIFTMRFPKWKAAWTPVGKGDKFKAAFLSDQIRDAYRFYFMIVKIWEFLGLLAITVASLGLLGTVVFTIRNRVKEVSIRKVMGASAESLVCLLSKEDFFVLMIIAGVIAVPTVSLFMERLLLTGQYYNVPIGAVEIIISLSIMLLVGMIYDLSQTLKAANIIRRIIYGMKSMDCDGTASVLNLKPFYSAARHIRN